MDTKQEFELFLKTERERFNKELDRLLPPENEYPEILYKAIRHSVFAGGKRIRPILVRIAADGFNFNSELIYPAGAAIEMIHTYSLIHDDLPALDNDDLRRGRSTCHKKYGEAIAILAGDALNTLAFGVLASLPLPEGMEKADLQVIRELSEYAGVKGMARGQVVDITSEETDISRNTLEFIHKNKTAALITCSLRTGCLLSNADEDSLEKMTRLGELIGLAFQIKDDILDLTSSTVDLGKTAGKDSARKKATYPALLGIERAQTELERLCNEATTIAEGFAKNNLWLYHMIDYLSFRRS